MKYGLGLLFLLIPTHILLSQEITVQKLNEGSCWVLEEEGAKVASFNDGAGFHLSQNNVQDLLAPFLKGGRPDSLDTMIHCSGSGAAVVFNLSEKDRKYCLWTKFQKGELELLGMGRSERDSGPCDGMALGKVTLKTFSRITNEEVQRFLDGKVYEGTLKSYDGQGNWWTVTGKDRFFHREEALKEEMMGSGLFETFEFDYLRHHQGEFLKINGLSL